jgi:uncharacterized sporulation protein YeaH/YhbH (DUF444 family)
VDSESSCQSQTRAIHPGEKEEKTSERFERDKRKQQQEKGEGKKKVTAECCRQFNSGGERFSQ